MGVAIGWFASSGYTVCVPLTDSQSYDLVVERGEGLKRVFVRTTTQTESSGSYTCGLRTQGGNKSQFKIKHFDNSCADLVFIICEDGSMYNIPSCEITTKSAVTLSGKWLKYKVVFAGLV